VVGKHGGDGCGASGQGAGFEIGEGLNGVGLASDLRFFGVHIRYLSNGG